VPTLPTPTTFRAMWTCEPWNSPVRSAATTPTSTANALGLTFEALVFVTMRAGDRDTVDAFEQAVAAIPDVLQAQRLFGDPDYLLRIITRDLPAYQQLYDNRLATLPGVQRLSSTLVMKSVVEKPAPAPMRTERVRHLTGLTS
jgi:DNA-binding Lrp family transcriptional regulator